MEKERGLYGAAIERGEITAIEEGEYRIRSLSRSGIETPPIPAIEWTIGTEDGDRTIRAKYETGETVYFVLYEDGTGVILGK